MMFQKIYIYRNLGVTYSVPLLTSHRNLRTIIITQLRAHSMKMMCMEKKAKEIVGKANLYFSGIWTWISCAKTKILSTIFASLIVFEFY
jgi:hypothetical protein